MNTADYHFSYKPAAPEQRELIHNWLQQDYISEWVHGQGLQNTFTGLENFFSYQAQGKKFDRQTKITQHWIGYDGKKPFVYLMTSNVFPEDEYAKYKKLDEPAITLDIFIGEQTYVGKGIASRVIKEFLLHHFADVTEVFIDPEIRNERATHVYQKTGFKIVGEFITSWHPVPHLIMRLCMQDLR